MFRGLWRLTWLEIKIFASLGADVSLLSLPIDTMHPVLRAIARVQPYTYAVSLLRGVASGDGWYVHAGDVTALCLVFLTCTVVSARVFRWE